MVLQTKAVQNMTTPKRLTLPFTERTSVQVSEVDLLSNMLVLETEKLPIEQIQKYVLMNNNTANTQVEKIWNHIQGLRNDKQKYYEGTILSNTTIFNYFGSLANKIDKGTKVQIFGFDGAGMLYVRNGDDYGWVYSQCVLQNVLCIRNTNNRSLSRYK
jgi:hypothetical protein